MCGRYYTNDETDQEIEKLVHQISEKLRNERNIGEIYPTNPSLVLAQDGKELMTSLQFFGFPSPKNKSVIINARSETVLEKKMFRNSILSRRCIIPTAWFYEWDHGKNKLRFFREDSNVLFIAGFYNQFSSQKHFVILTTKANSSIADVHSRMPLILEPEQLTDWIFKNEKLEDILKKEPCLLCRKSESEYEQQVLKFE